MKDQELHSVVYLLVSVIADLAHVVRQLLASKGYYKVDLLGWRGEIDRAIKRLQRAKELLEEKGV